MAKATGRNASSSKQKSRPALTPEGRENQLISMAMDCAEEQIRNGTASSQVLTHFLKLGSIKQQVELEKLRNENELLKAKTESLQSQQRIEAMYSEALSAMRSYSGLNPQEDDVDD